MSDAREDEGLQSAEMITVLRFADIVTALHVEVGHGCLLECDHLGRGRGPDCIQTGTDTIERAITLHLGVSFTSLIDREEPDGTDIEPLRAPAIAEAQLHRPVAFDIAVLLPTYFEIEAGAVRELLAFGDRFLQEPGNIGFPDQMLRHRAFSAGYSRLGKSGRIPIK